MSDFNDANRDPLTNEPGAHPVGTGVGAMMGGAAAGAAAGALGGPVGAAIGGVAGAVAGGLAGKAAAEAVNPTAEDAYWRESYEREPYYVGGRTYDQYRPAYELGWSSVDRYEGDFEAVEPRLADDWRARHSDGLAWTDARPAARAAWDRVSSARINNGRPLDVADNDDTVDVLNDLLESARDGEYGFTACAERAHWRNSRGYSSVMRGNAPPRPQSWKAKSAAWVASLPRAAPWPGLCTAAGCRSSRRCPSMTTRQCCKSASAARTLPWRATAKPCSSQCPPMCGPWWNASSKGRSATTTKCVACAIRTRTPDRSACTPGAGPTCIEGPAAGAMGASSASASTKAARRNPWSLCFMGCHGARALAGSTAAVSTPHAIVSTTGAWSLGCGFLRGARSMVQAVTAPRSASLTRMWSMRSPRFF